MKEIKWFIDKCFNKLVKQVAMTKNLTVIPTVQVQVANSSLCYCVLVDGVVVSTIPLEKLYVLESTVIKTRIEDDIDTHLNKLYGKTKAVMFKE